MDDEILTIGVTSLIFGLLALAIIYIYALPQSSNGPAPFAMIIENAKNG